MTPLSLTCFALVDSDEGTTVTSAGNTTTSLPVIAVLLLLFVKVMLHFSVSVGTFVVFMGLPTVVAFWLTVTTFVAL